MQRKGPGLLLRDLLRGEDTQIASVLTVLEAVSPDILLIQGFDYDLTGAALTRFAELADYPYSFTARPNSGRQTGLDVDGDGRTGEPEDALGFGWFSGEGGMAILSRWPIDQAGVTDFSGFLWRDLPDALLPDPNDIWPSQEVYDSLPLASVAHWIVPVIGPSRQRVNLLAFHASPPVFDGPEDRNGRRNHDQIVFWRHVLDGTFGPAPPAPFILLGDANLDPAGGEGRRDAIRLLLNDPRLQALAPEGTRGMATVDWDDPVPGDLRVSYILPSRDLIVTATEIVWPDAGAELSDAVGNASRHRMVWADIELP